MDVTPSSALVTQAVATARVALAEAAVLKLGQVLQALVMGTSADGLTTLKLGEQTVKAALPQMLSPGSTLELQVKSGGTAPQLAIVRQTPPPAAPASAAVRPVAAVPANPQPAQRVMPLPSQIESAPVAARPIAGPLSAEPAMPRDPATSPAAAARAPQAVERPPVAGQGAPPATPAAATIRTEQTSAAPIPNQAGQEPLSQPSAVPVAPMPTQPAETEASAPVARLAAPPPANPAPSAAGQPPTGDQSLPSSGRTVSAPAPSSQAAPPASEPEATNPLLLAQSAERPRASVADLPRSSTLTRPALPAAQAAAQPAAATAASTPQAPQDALARSPAPATPISAAPTSTAAPPQTPRAALAQMLPEALAKQDSAGPLLVSLAQLIKKPLALPEPILRAALRVLAQRIVVTPEGRVAATDLEAAVLRSGLGLESTLAKGEAAPADAKAGLLALRDALSKALGNVPAAPPTTRDAPQAAAPPLKGLPLRAAPIEAPALPDLQRDAVHQVHGQADAAIARLKLMQMASLPDGDPGKPAPPVLRMELPFLIGHELVMAQIEVGRDGARREAERKRGWTMRFALNFSATGEVGAEVGLLGKAVNVALWAAEPDTAAALNAALPELAGALEAIGLNPGAVRIRHGTPEPTRPMPGRLLDSVS